MTAGIMTLRKNTEAAEPTGELNDKYMHLSDSHILHAIPITSIFASDAVKM